MSVKMHTLLGDYMTQMLLYMKTTWNNKNTCSTSK